MSQWQTIKTAFRQPWVQSVSSCIFFVLAYDGGRPVLSLTVSPSHQQYMASLIIAAELARGDVEQSTRKQFQPWWGFESRPFA